MIAYFGWTNTLLFNIFSLKQSVYRNIPGHLYVMVTDRISDSLIEAIEKSGAFEKVVRIKGNVADVSDNKSVGGKLKALFGKSEEILMFSDILKEKIPSSGYETVVTAAFWSSFLGFYREILKYNKNTDIVFVEEGYANYAGKKYLCRTLICGKTKERVYRIIRYGDIYNKAFSSVKVNYLYNPEAYMCADGLEPEKLPKFDFGDIKTIQLLRELYALSAFPEGRNVVYFAGPDDALEPSVTRDLFDKLPWGKMIYRDRVYGDGQKIIPEKAVFMPSLSAIEPFLAFDVNDESILIARNSTVLTLPKRMFGKEPWVVYTFGMYNIEKEQLNPLVKYAENFRESYSNKNKVIIAESADMIVDIINKVEEKHA